MVVDIFRDNVVVYSVEVDNLFEVNIINNVSKVVVDFYLNNPIQLIVNDYIIHEGVKYSLFNSPGYTLEEDGYHYNFDLYHDNYILANKLFQNKQGETSFSLTGNLNTFVDLLLWNINQSASNPNGVSLGWQANILLDTPYREIVFTSNFCLDVIKTLIDTYYCEVDLSVDRLISFQETISLDKTIDLEVYKENEDYEVNSVQHSTDFYTRAYIRGGYKNISASLKDEDGYLMSSYDYLENIDYYDNIVETKKIFKDEYPYYILPIKSKVNYNPNLFNIKVESQFGNKIDSRTRIKFLSGYFTNKEFEFSYDSFTGLINIIGEDLYKVEVGDLITFTEYDIPDLEITKSINRLDEIGQRWFNNHSYPLIRLTLDFSQTLFQQIDTYPIGAKVYFTYRGESYNNLRLLKVIRDIVTNEITLVISNYIDEEIYQFEYNYLNKPDSGIDPELIGRIEGVEKGLEKLDTRLTQEVETLNIKINSIDITPPEGTSHTHNNKSVLDQLKQSDIDLLSKFELDEGGRVKVLDSLYSIKGVSAYGLGPEESGGGSGGTFVEWGDTTNNYSPLLVEGVTKTVALSGHKHGWGDLTDRPNTIGGYGITDVYTKNQVDALITENIHTHANKTQLDLITQTHIEVLNKLFLDINGNLYTKDNFYSEKGISAYGLGPGGGDGGIIETVYGYDKLGQTFDNNVLTDTFNAYTINQINTRVTNLENSAGSGSVTSVGISVPTGLSVSNSPITSSGIIAIGLQTGYSIPTTVKQGQWDTAYSNTHTHSNKTVLDGITSTHIDNWDDANSKKHIHDNKLIIDQLTQANINVLNKLFLDTNGNLFTTENFYSEKGVSAYGLGPEGSGGGGIIEFVYGYSHLGQTFNNDTLTDTFNAYTINQLHLRLSDVESGSATSITTTGTGNAITSITKSGSVITAEKGSTFSLSTHTHSASDINSGTLAIARIPTGTTGTTVALGNHLHTGVYEPVFTKNNAFNKNFGTVAGTVAQGNDSRIINGQTAYGWGDHASAGYALNSALTAHTGNTTVHITANERTNWNTAFTNNHTHSNKGVLDGITSGLVSNWNTAYTNTHTHSNKAVIDQLTQANINVLAKLSIDASGNLKIDTNAYATGGISAYGLGPGGSGGGGIIEFVYGYSDLGQSFDDLTLTDTFNAYTINQINTRLVAVEAGAALTFNTTGSGNAITSISQVGTVITANKGSTFALASHTHSASDITSGTLSTARLGTGTPSSANYLRGDGVWAAVTSANNGQLTLSTGTGLTGSATFTANQSGNSTFSVGIASTHTLPTNTQVSNWNTAYGWGDYREYGLGTTLLNLSSSTLDFSGVTTFLKGQDSGLIPGRNYYGLSIQNSSTYGMQIVGRDLDWHVRGLENGTLTSWSTLWHSNNFNPSNYVPTSRTITAGNGLTGGGALSANITLALDTTYADNRYVTRTTAQTITGAKTFTSLTIPAIEGALGVETFRVSALSQGYGWPYGNSLSQIRTGINFGWYNTNWAIGNIRGGGTDSYGFGIGYIGSDGNLGGEFRIAPGGLAYLNNVQIATRSTTLSGYGITDAVTLNTTQTITGTKTFTGNVLIKGAAADSPLRVRGIDGHIDSTGLLDNLYLNFVSTKDILMVNGGGNVGIGTTSPTEKLDVSGSIASTGGTNGRYSVLSPSGLRSYGATSGWVQGHNFFMSDGTSLGFSSGAYASGASVFNYFFYGGAYTDPSVVILPNKNVGIGTTSPSYKLDVSGTGRFTGTITAPLYQSGTYNWASKTGGFHSGVDGQLAGGMSWYDGSGSSANIYRQNNLLILGRANNQSLTIDTSSNVNILGDTSTNRLIISSTGAVSHIEFSRPSYNYLTTPLNGSINFVTNGDSLSASNSMLVLSPNGNVGVGKGFTNNTTSVTAQLHVRGNILSTGEVTAFLASDRRLKENIKPITSALDHINRLNPVTYNWNARAKELNSNKPNSLDYGLIAQEVEEVLPNIVHGIFDDKYKSIDYIKLIPITISAIQEVDKSLKDEISMLKDRVRELENILMNLKN